MPDLPTGTVTFLFTDIEGSTKRWEQEPQAMQVALARHDAILRATIEAQEGHVFKTVGDAFCAGFADAHKGLTAALAAQRAVSGEDWDSLFHASNSALRVRMALHTGVVEQREGDYFGQPLNRVARLLSAGHGGQTLLSLGAYEMVRDNLPAGVQLLDLGEHRLKDLTRPERIFQLVATGLPSEFPPLKTLDNRPNNLPFERSPLIGRESEVASVVHILMRPNVGLLTLTGPGGTGKTRLALQAAAELVDDFEDGVFFVNLAPITDHNLVASTIAQTLGVKEAAGTPMIDTLQGYLRERQILLLLDNFEQVVEAAPQVGQLLAGCPKLKVLVTSRVPLRVRNEHEYAVPPLALPPMASAGSKDARPAQPVETLTQYEAVRLFIERAQAIKSDFEVNNDNAPAVAEICVRLDGLPLAIELAAARIRLLPPQAMLTRLQSRLKLLTGGARDLPARQQTLSNTIEWSYDLLEAGEKQLFRRLAVFQGGRTLEAIEAVCNADGDFQVDVLDGVESLVSESLTRQVEGVEGEPRFVMLETIHEFARERLEESGEGEALRRHHALYFVGLAEEAEPHLIGHRQVEWMDRLEEEHDNLRAALRWAIDGKQVGVALAICGGIGEFWIRRGHHTEGREWLAQSLSLPPEPENTAHEPVKIIKARRAKALLVAARLAMRRSDYNTARPLFEESLALFADVGNESGMALVLIDFPGSIVNLSTDEANSYAERALNLARESGNSHAIAYALYRMGDTALNHNDLTSAYNYYSESIGLSREAGGKALAALTLTKLAGIARSRGDFPTAQAQYEESLALYRELKDRYTATYPLANLGALAHQQGSDESAAMLLEQTLAVAKEFEYRYWAAGILCSLGALRLYHGDSTSAHPILEEAVALANEEGDDSLTSACLSMLGWVRVYEADPMAATALFQQSLEMAGPALIGGQYAPAAQQVATSMVGLARTQLLAGQVKCAATLLGASQTFRESLTPPSVLEGTVEGTVDRAEYRRTVAMVRAQLDEATWQATWEEGHAMSMEQAIAYALEETAEQT
jgi:predicted ATPase/class 3 adenylate cyclase